MSNNRGHNRARPSPQNTSRNRTSYHESTDDTIELLTGFTPRQLESINRLVSARVDRAFGVQTPQVPQSPTPHQAQRTRRSLAGQRSLHDLISARNNDRAIDMLPGESHGGDGIRDVSQPSSENSQANAEDQPPAKDANQRPNTSVALGKRPDTGLHPALRIQVAGPEPTVGGLSVCDFQPQTFSSTASSPQIIQTQLSLPDVASSDTTSSPSLSPRFEVQYLTVHPYLPPNTPLPYPHIVDVATVKDGLPQKRLGMADLVVTILYNYEAQVLNKFLNLSKKTFRFRRLPANPNEKSFTIEREQKFVTVGIFSANGKTIEESLTYRIIDGATGPWSPLSIRGGKNASLRGPKDLDAYVRREFAKFVLCQKIWGKGEDVKITVECK